MHISEGVLSAPILISAAAIAAVGVVIGVKKMDVEQIPKVAILTSVFYVASLIHIPLGGVSVHLILNGLLGIMLGWMALPAIFIALLLQFLTFSFGGPTSLGINVVIMGTPALISYYLYRIIVHHRWISKSVFIFICGASSIFLSGVLLATALFLAGKEFLLIAKVSIIAHIPLMVVEGMITLFCYRFLEKVKPDLLRLGGR